MGTNDGIHEVFEGDVQYPYADVGASELLHISKVNQDNRKDFKYTCPYCKNTLRPRLSRGSRRSHFAHNPGECCDQDRYIHSTAERLLKEKWDRNEPFEITFGVRTICNRHATCFYSQAYKHQCFFQKPETFDLKKHYSTCLVEKKYGEFIPDLCLIDESGKHEPIFIEIWSTHKNSEKKAESDYQIIEIRLRTVADLEELPKRPITESETVKFSHFKTRKREPNATDGLELMKYTLYADSLKSYVDTKSVSCSNYNTKHHGKAVLEIVGAKNDFYTVNHFRKYCNAIAVEKGNDIRSCYLCRQYGDVKSTSVWDAELCRFTEPERGCRRDIKGQGIIQCKPDDAKTCDHFVRRDYTLKRIMETYADMPLYIWERRPDGTEAEEYRQGKTEDSPPVSFDVPGYLV